MFWPALKCQRNKRYAQKTTVIFIIIPTQNTHGTLLVKNEKRGPAEKNKIHFFLHFYPCFWYTFSFAAFISVILIACVAEMEIMPGVHMHGRRERTKRLKIQIPRSSAFLSGGVRQILRVCCARGPGVGVILASKAITQIASTAGLRTQLIARSNAFRQEGTTFKSCACGLISKRINACTWGNALTA